MNRISLLVRLLVSTAIILSALGEFVHGIEHGMVGNYAVALVACVGAIMILLDTPRKRAPAAT